MKLNPQHYYAMQAMKRKQQAQTASKHDQLLEQYYNGLCKANKNEVKKFLEIEGSTII
jgi:hypothetical protein